MKCFSIYNEKGGTGKTTLTVMFASYLAYEKDARVLVVDLENPTWRIMAHRNKDIALLKKSDSALSRWFVEHDLDFSAELFYSIITDGEEINHYNDRNLQILFDRFRNMYLKSGEYDYVLVDFPGGYSDDIPVSMLSASGILEHVFVPVNLDEQTLDVAVNFSAQLRDPQVDVPVSFIWNNVRGQDIDDDFRRKGGDKLTRVERYFSEKNLGPFCPWRIKNFAKAERGADKQYFVRNTVCWPSENADRWCNDIPRKVSLVKTFEWMKGRLDEDNY